METIDIEGLVKSPVTHFLAQPKACRRLHVSGRESERVL